MGRDAESVARSHGSSSAAISATMQPIGSTARSTFSTSVYCHRGAARCDMTFAQMVQWATPLTRCDAYPPFLHLVLRKKWLAGLTHTGTRLAGGPLPRTGGPDRCLGGVSSCREEQFALRGDPQSILAPGMLYHDLALTLKQCSARDAAQRLGAYTLREHGHRCRASWFLP